MSATSPEPKDFDELCLLDGDTVFIKMPTWVMNPKLPWDKLKLKFEKNPRQAGKDYGNRYSTAIEEHFFQNFELLEGIAKRSEKKHPFKDDAKVILHDWFRPCCRAKQYVHGDLGAKRDALGVAMCHLCRKTRKITLDFMLRVTIPVGSELHLKTFRQLVYQLKAKGFWIDLVTTDSWQSRETHQELQRRGYRSEFYSVDKNLEPWDTFWDLATEDRVEFYAYEPFLEEAKEVQLVDGKKVDHPSNGSKDVADAVVGCVTKCVMNDQHKPLRITVI